MKILISFLLSIMVIGSAIAQPVTLPLRADSVRIYKNGGTAELIIENSTKDSTNGLFTNIGKGRTKFLKPYKLNDSTLVIGGIGYKVGGGGSGGAITDTTWLKYLGIGPIYPFTSNLSGDTLNIKTLNFHAGVKGTVKIDSTIDVVADTAFIYANLPIKPLANGSATTVGSDLKSIDWTGPMTIDAIVDGLNAHSVRMQNLTKFSATITGDYDVNATNVYIERGASVRQTSLNLISFLRVTVSSSQNDFGTVTSGINAAGVIYLNATTNLDITGFKRHNSTTTPNGRVIFVHNVGTGTITIRNQNASSIDTNRLNMNADLTLLPAQSATFQYDTAIWRWANTSVSGSGGVTGTVTSVGTGFGLSGGPITTIGTLLADSNVLVTRQSTQEITGVKRFNAAVVLLPQTGATTPFATGLTIYDSVGWRITRANGIRLGLSLSSLTANRSDSFPDDAGTFVLNQNTAVLSNKSLDNTNTLAGVTMTLGSDATNDMYYRNSSGKLTRLAAPAHNGMHLNYISGNYAFTDTAAASGATNAVGRDTVTTITSGSSSTVPNGTNVFQFNPTSAIGSYTLTLPTTWHTSNDLLIVFTANGTLTNGMTMVTNLTLVNGSGHTWSYTTNPSGKTYKAGESIRIHLISTVEQVTN